MQRDLLDLLYAATPEQELLTSSYTVNELLFGFEAPIGDPPQFTVEAFEATPAR